MGCKQSTFSSNHVISPSKPERPGSPSSNTSKESRTGYNGAESPDRPQREEEQEQQQPQLLALSEKTSGMLESSEDNREEPIIDATRRLTPPVIPQLTRWSGTSEHACDSIGGEDVAVSTNESIFAPKVRSAEEIAQGAEDMLAIVKEALDQWNIVYEEVPRERRFNPNIALVKFQISTMYTTNTIMLSMDSEDEVLTLFNLYSLLRVVEERRREVARYLAAVNFEVLLGHFDLDFRDGEVRYKVSEIVQGSKLSKQIVLQLVGVSLKMVDRYLPGLMACEFGGMSAEESFDETRRIDHLQSSPPTANSQ